MCANSSTSRERKRLILASLLVPTPTMNGGVHVSPGSSFLKTTAQRNSFAFWSSPPMFSISTSTFALFDDFVRLRDMLPSG